MTDANRCFFPTKILAGQRALEHLPFELGALGAGKPLILLGPGEMQAGLDRVLVEACGDSGLVLAFSGGVDAPPDPPALKDLAKIYHERGCDALVAAGRGFVVDTAKVLNIAVSGEPGDLRRYAGREKIPGRLRPFVCIPGSAGTGYELTRHARSAEAEYDSFFLMPDLALVDARMSARVEPLASTQSALVTLVHAVEAYLSPCPNPFVEAYAAAAIALLRDHLAPLIREGRSSRRQTAVVQAAAFAAGVFSNTPAGLTHRLGEALAAESDLSPGLCMGILLPPVMDRFGVRQGRDLSRLLLPLAGFEECANTAPERTGPQILAHLRGLVGKALQPAGIRPVLRDAGVSKGAWEKAISRVVVDAAEGEEDLRALLAEAWEGQTV